MATKILLVDDSPVIRRGLRLFIERQTDFEVCGEAENGRQAVEMVERLSPDVVILDLAMPVMNGLDAARQIRELVPDVYILLFTLQAYPQLLEDAQKVGVNQVLSKYGEAGTTLLGAVRSMVAA